MIRILSVLTLSELQRGEDSSPPPRDGDGGATDASGGGDPVATPVRHEAAFLFVVPTPTVLARPPAPTVLGRQSTVFFTSPRKRDGSVPEQDGDGCVLGLLNFRFATILTFATIRVVLQGVLQGEDCTRGLIQFIGKIECFLAARAGRAGPCK